MGDKELAPAPEISELFYKVPRSLFNTLERTRCERCGRTPAVREPVMVLWHGELGKFPDDALRVRQHEATLCCECAMRVLNKMNECL